MLLLNSLGTDLRIWECVVDLLPELRAIELDKRGHGLSAMPERCWTLDDLVQYVVALLDHLGIRRALVAGCSIGGMIAQAMAVAAPEPVVGGDPIQYGDECGTVESWTARINGVQTMGLQGLAPQILERWFSPGFPLATRSVLEGQCWREAILRAMWPRAVCWPWPTYRTRLAAPWHRQTRATWCSCHLWFARSGVRAPLFHAQARFRAVRLEIGRVDHDGFVLGALGGKADHDSGENPVVAPALPTVGKGLDRPLFLRRIAPAQTSAIDEDYAAEYASIINAGLAMTLRKERLQTHHLGVAQPIEVAHRSRLLAASESFHKPEINGSAA